MTREEVFAWWAPDGAAWSPWAKPVLFAHLPPAAEPPADEGAPGALEEAGLQVPPVPAADGRTAVVIDLPGAEGVRLGLALAERGYRPVPL